MAKRKKKRFIVILILLALALTSCFIFIPDFAKKKIYPLNYEKVVEKYAEKYDIDKYIIMAFIKTESGFDSNATSKVGARGLMQIMPDAYDWLKTKLKDKRNHSYDDMYDAELNIEYGTYYVSYLYNKYGSLELAAAAYHAGITRLESWLKDSNYSNDGKSLDKIPSKSTAHYVDKITSCYNSYKNLYSNE